MAFRFSLHLCLLFARSILPHVAAGSFGSRHGGRYAAYDYDLTTPLYTPDGRLLQVEYATQACLREREGGNPIACVGTTADGGDAALVMATVSSPPRSSQEANGKVAESVPIHARSWAQFRIIEVPLSVTSTVLVGLSGILSDATSLLRVVHARLEEEQRAFGWHRLSASPVGVADTDVSSDGGSRTPFPGRHSQSTAARPSETALRLSRAVADECQAHAFGGGLRPYGASLLLAGVDGGCRVAMCETHPNGGCRSGVSHLTGSLRESDAHLQLMVSGGPARAQREVEQLIRSRWRQLRTQSPAMASSEKDRRGTRGNDCATAEKQVDDALTLRRTLRAVIAALVEEWEHRGDPPRPPSGASAATADEDPRRGNPSHCEWEQGRRPPTLPVMEVVIASPARGAVRLTQSDIIRLMRPAPSMARHSADS